MKCVIIASYRRSQHFRTNEYEKWNNIPHYTQTEINGRGPCESFYLTFCPFTCQFINHYWYWTILCPVCIQNRPRKGNWIILWNKVLIEAKKNIFHHYPSVNCYLDKTKTLLAATGDLERKKKYSVVLKFGSVCVFCVYENQIVPPTLFHVHFTIQQNLSTRYPSLSMKIVTIM